MSDTFGLSEINELVEALTVAMIEERDAIRELTGARAALDTEKARIVKEAADAGKIDMKNADTRKMGEMAALELSNGVYWLALIEQNAAYKLENREIDRKSIEAEISLTKAWLYSQSGGQR